MKLSSMVFGGVVLSMLGGLAAAVGCGSSSDSGSSSGGTTTVGQPPARPSGPATTSTTFKNLAVKHVYLGDTKRGSTARDQDAWKAFGYNIDGKVSKASDTDGCKLVAGAPSQTRDDGDNGIDNSFGQHILPILLAAGDASKTMNNAIETGKFTLMLYVKGLDENPKQTATGLGGAILAGSDFGGTPTFTKADNWPVRPETLSSKTDPTSSTIRLDDGYIVDGTYVYQGNVEVALSFGGISITLALHKASLTFDRKGTDGAENGTLAGVIKTTDLLTQFQKLRGVSTVLCGSVFDNIVDQVKKTSDIMSDGSAGSPSTECDAISLALGFEATEIGAPQKVGPAAGAAQDQCADAGADGGK